MCIIIVAETEFPFNKVLQLSELQNGHGGGIAYIKEGKVYYHKALTAKQIGKFRHTTEGPWLIHFRIGTVGGLNASLTHPFPVSMDTGMELDGSSEAVIAHNGHYPWWKEELFRAFEEGDSIPEGPWSDSRAMAWLIGKYGESYIPNFIYQKVAYLDKNGIRRYGSGWVKHGPLWLSNDPFGKRYAESFPYAKAQSFRDFNLSTLGV